MNLRAWAPHIGRLTGLILLAGGANAARAQAQNLALTATATASSSWEDGTDFGAPKINDNDPTTRWNARADDVQGSWLTLTWPSAVTFNKVEVDEDFNRMQQYQLQVPDGDDWKTIYDSEGTNINPTGSQTPVHTVTFSDAITANALRLVAVQTTAVASIFEIEVFNATLGTLKGTVKDSSGAAIKGATVTVGGSTATTDDSGAYSLTTEAGTADVTASKPGLYRSRSSLNVSIPANGTATQDFTLIALPTDLALTATTSASTYYQNLDDYSDKKINDGDLTTRWNSDSGDISGSYLSLTWTTAQTFNSIAIYEALGRITNYTVSVLDSSGIMKDLATNDLEATGKDRLILIPLSSPVTTKELDITINEASNLPSIYEVQVTNAPQSSIQGVVVDKTTGKPVPGATVTLSPGGTIGVTDDQGAFQAVVGPDDYRISATAANYFDSDSQIVSVNEGQVSNVTIDLPAKGDNLALKATASASYDLPDTNPASAVNDGDLTTSWTTDSDNTKNQWIELTFSQPTTFNVVELEGFVGVIQKSVIQTLGADGQTWTDVPNTTINPETLASQGKPAILILDQPVTATSVRYFIYYTNGDANVPGLSEFELFNAPIGQTGGGTTPTLGDLNGDDKINVQDATIALRIAVGLTTPTDDQKAAGDVNQDGKWNVQDATLILQVAVGLKTGF
jgi:hypothetical protein